MGAWLSGPLSPPPSVKLRLPGLFRLKYKPEPWLLNGIRYTKIAGVMSGINAILMFLFGNFTLGILATFLSMIAWRDHFRFIDFLKLMEEEADSN